MIKIERTGADDTAPRETDAIINVIVAAGLYIGRLSADVDALKLAVEVQRADETDLASAHREIERLESLVAIREIQASDYSKLIKKHVEMINELQKCIEEMKATQHA